jgi:hypothetical protein
MRSKLFLAFTLALAIPLAACGGDDDGGDDTISVADSGVGNPDAPDTPQACNPVEGTGCEAGEKCAYVFDSFPDLGRTACAPEGDKVLNDACTRDETSGVDDCAAGLQCLSGFCREICSSAPDSCTTDYACSRYSAYFGDNENVGVCDPRCNPVTGTRDFDDAANCGSVSTEEPELGCYGVSDRPFTCSPAGDPMKTHGDDARDENGNLFINACAPGHLVGFVNTHLDNTPICRSTCSPVETHSGATDEPGGATPYACGELGAINNECRFWWWFEDNPSVERNYIGQCWNYLEWEYDSTGDMEVDTPWPSCTTLANTDTDGNDAPDHLEWGCGPYPASLFGNAKASFQRAAVVQEGPALLKKAW